MATAIEYGLIAALIGVGVVTAVTAFSGANQDGFTEAVEPVPVARFSSSFNDGRPYLRWTERGAEVACDYGVLIQTEGDEGPPAFSCADALP